ncbi:MAG: NAD(P)-binding domain-containing protein [Terriglobales bacterium]
MASLFDLARTLVAPKRPEPSYPQLPAVRREIATNVPGLYVAGDLAGAALIKTSLHQGMAVAAAVAAGTRSRADYDLIVIGTGAAGFAALVRAHELGLRALGLDAGKFAQSIHSFTKGKVLFAEPLQEPLRSSVWFEECTKEVLLEKWADQKAALGIVVQEFEPVRDVQRVGGALTVTTPRGTYRAGAVLLASGKSGNPRKAGVPGEIEYAPRIAHRLADPDAYSGRQILIYGGGDVAAEAALALADSNQVTLATVDPHWIFPRKRNIERMERKQRAGRLAILFDTRLAAVGDTWVTLRNQSSGAERRLDNDFVFEMIGAELPVDFLRRIGVRLDNQWTSLRLLTALVTLSVAFLLYAIKKAAPPFSGFSFPDFANRHPWTHVLLRLPAGVTPKDAPAFWYTVLYTLLVTGFGIRAFRRWGKRDRYQRWRYVSFIAFQVGFFLLVNFVLARLMPKYYWRGWGLYQPFPLFFNSFFWWYPGDPVLIKWGFIGFGLLLTFVLIPLFVRRHGMRFCTWICGCGALAETFGDPWRHRSPKGVRSRLWEFQGPLIVIWAFASLAVIAVKFHSRGDNAVWHAYDYIVDFWLVAVIPVGLYPFFGGKVWCRYWCPLAHYMKWMSARFSRLQIVANDKCIQCTECSKYCQVGVDVMAFAKNGESFDNTNSSCIHCGICITVCPMNVLSFQLKPSPGRAHLVQIETGH